MVRFLVFAMAVGAGIAALAVAVAQPPGAPLTDSITAQQTAYYAAPYPMARPAPYYSPRMAVNQPVGPYPPATASAPRGSYLPPSAYGPSYGGMPARVAQAPAVAPRPAVQAPAPAPAAAGPYNGSAAHGASYGDEWSSGYNGDAGCGCGRGCSGHGRHGGYDMPQHYPYYPPMHGYYYFHPYHYTHVPAQQAFASQFGVDTRNPYSNDFFKVVYAEYKASLLRPSEEPIGTPVPESPADTIKKLKALNDEGILSQEEFEAKKTEILQRM